MAVNKPNSSSKVVYRVGKQGGKATLIGTTKDRKKAIAEANKYKQRGAEGAKVTERVTSKKNPTVKKNKTSLSPKVTSTYKNKLNQAAQKAELKGLAQNVINTPSGTSYVRKGLNVSVSGGIKNPKVKVKSTSRKFIARKIPRNISMNGYLKK